VQAIVRGDGEPPPGLAPPQRDEVAGWMRALAGKRAELRERLGVDPAATPGRREAPVAFDDVVLEPEAPPPKTAFRWQTNRGGVGFFAGTVLGIGVAFFVSRGLMPFTAFGGATTG